MNRAFEKVRSALPNAVKKFTNPSVNRGKTTYPKNPKDLQNLGIRCDYDGEEEVNGTFHNKFQVQPNAGTVPSTIRRWREKNGGTHAVMGVMYVKNGGSEEDVTEGWDKFVKEFLRALILRRVHHLKEGLKALDLELEVQVRRNGLGGRTNAYGIAR